MQLRLAGPVVRLDEEPSDFAVGDDASEACLEARSATGDDDGADFAGPFQALVVMTLWGYNLLRVEVEAFHGPVAGLEHATIPLVGFSYLSIRRLDNLSK